MSTIKTNGEDLILNADGPTKKVEIRVDDVVIASADTSGLKSASGTPYISSDDLTTDKVQYISATSSPQALNGTIYDTFFISNPTQDTVLDIYLEIGRTVSVFIFSPSTHTITWNVTGNTNYWWSGGEVITPDEVGMTIVTMTRVDNSNCILSGQTGYAMV